MKYDDEYIKMMVEIIDLLPEIAKDCPEVNSSDTFLLLCEMREELIDALQGQTKEMNDTATLFELSKVFGKTPSRNN